MIITKQKSYDDIIRALGHHRKVFIVGCGSCATACETGGEAQVAACAAYLLQHGFTVVGTCIPDETCHIPLVKKSVTSQQHWQDAEAFIVLACGAGSGAVHHATHAVVIPGVESVFLGTTERVGMYAQLCSLCGECMLAYTGGLCPVTICPKSMLNGPCGGMHDGMCEIDLEKKCVWVLIIDLLHKKNMLHVLDTMPLYKDHSKKIRTLDIRQKKKH